jgi:hypothetical protein
MVAAIAPITGRAYRRSAGDQHAEGEREQREVAQPHHGGLGFGMRGDGSGDGYPVVGGEDGRIPRSTAMESGPAGRRERRAGAARSGGRVDRSAVMNHVSQVPGAAFPPRKGSLVVQLQGDVPVRTGNAPGTARCRLSHTHAVPNRHAALRRVVAYALFGIVLLEGAIAAAAAALAGTALTDLIDGFVVTNAAIGLSCGLAGVLIAGQRPRNPLGWLLLGAGVFQTASAALGALGGLGAVNGWPEPLQRTLASGFAFAWPWSIAGFLPLALLVFPDGLLPGRLWRIAAGAVVVSAPLFALRSGRPRRPADRRRTCPPGGWCCPADDQLGALWTAEELLNLTVLALAVAGPAVRYRRGEGCAAVGCCGCWRVWLMFVIVVLWALFTAGPILDLLSIALVPLAMDDRGATPLSC